MFMQLWSVTTNLRWQVKYPRDTFSIHLKLKWNECWMLYLTASPLACYLCSCLLCTHRLSKANFKGAYLCANCVHTAAERQICFLSVASLFICCCCCCCWVNEGGYWKRPMSVVYCPWVCVAAGFVPWSVQVVCVFFVCLTDRRTHTDTKRINTASETEH